MLIIEENIVELLETQFLNGILSGLIGRTMTCWVILSRQKQVFLSFLKVSVFNSMLEKAFVEVIGVKSWGSFADWHVKGMDFVAEGRGLRKVSASK